MRLTSAFLSALLIAQISVSTVQASCLEFYKGVERQATADIQKEKTSQKLFGASLIAAAVCYPCGLIAAGTGLLSFNHGKSVSSSQESLLSAQLMSSLIESSQSGVISEQIVNLTRELQSERSLADLTPAQTSQVVKELDSQDRFCKLSEGSTVEINRKQAYNLIKTTLQTPPDLK